MQIPFLNVTRQVQELRPELDAAIKGVLDSGQFLLGEKVTLIEENIADLMGAKYGVACACGTDAIFLALTTLGVGPGDEVITTPFTFIASVTSIARAGARPVFADIDPETLNISVESVARSVTDKTKAIIPVHLFGYAADMDPLLELASEKGVAVIEDAAQAIGTLYKGKPVGALGSAGILSFYPTKNIGAAGDAGMLLTNSVEVATQAKLIRNHGSTDAVEYPVIGICSRMDAMQAAVLLARLPRLEEKNNRRRAIAAVYNDRFASLPLVLPPAGDAETTNIYHHYTIRTNDREALLTHLREKGVGFGVYYSIPHNRQECFARFDPAECPVAEKAAREVVQLPVFPELTDDEVTTVADAVAGFFD